MKTKRTSFSNPITLHTVFSAAVATLTSLALPTAAQSVVIEGGPGEIQISDEDGKPEPVSPGGAIAVPVPSPAPDSTAVSPVIPGQPVTPEITPQGVNAPAPPKMFGPATADTLDAETRARSEAPATINVDVAKRLAEIERELNIASAATAAKVSIETKDLFVENTPQVDALAEPTLKTVAEYIRLRESESIDVTYHYTPVTENEKQAWERSVALIKWMTTKGQTNGDQYQIKNPKVAAEDDTSLNAESGEGAEFTGVIELMIR